MSTCIERGFYLTSLQPKYTGLLRPIGIGENFLLGLRILSNLSLLPSSIFPLPSLCRIKTKKIADIEYDFKYLLYLCSTIN